MRLSELLSKTASAQPFAWVDVSTDAGAMDTAAFVAAVNDPGGAAVTDAWGTLIFMHSASAWSGPDPHNGGLGPPP